MNALTDLVSEIEEQHRAMKTTTTRKKWVAVALGDSVYCRGTPALLASPVSHPDDHRRKLDAIHHHTSNCDESLAFFCDVVLLVSSIYFISHCCVVSH